MEAFTALTSTAAPLEDINVDTDQIIPARFLRFPRKDGYGSFLFRDMRLTEDGQEKPEFVMNQPPYRSAKILVANTNFGCGSSREGAVYALFDYGYRCVIAPSFGDIFFNNCFKNGLLPVKLSAAEVAEIRRIVCEHPDTEISVDLERQTVTLPNRKPLSFQVDPFWKMCMQRGLDDISFTIEHRGDIEAYEKRHAAEQPWLHIGEKKKA